jgi:hypothetical protein
MVAYGSDVDISVEEVGALETRLRLTGLACMLTNEYWGFPKAMSACEKMLGYPVDAVRTPQRIEGLEVREARKKVGELAVKYEKEGMAVAEGLMGLGSKLAENSRRYVQGECWAAGEANYWSSTCSRYHSYE